MNSGTLVPLEDDIFWSMAMRLCVSKVGRMLDRVFKTLVHYRKPTLSKSAREKQERGQWWRTKQESRTRSWGSYTLTEVSFERVFIHSNHESHPLFPNPRTHLVSHVKTFFSGVDAQLNIYHDFYLSLV